jgi:hypothetical protein
MKEKTINDLIKELQELKHSLREKPIKVKAPNGLRFEPKLKLDSDFDGNIKGIVITYD